MTNLPMMRIFKPWSLTLQTFDIHDSLGTPNVQKHAS